MFATIPFVCAPCGRGHQTRGILNHPIQAAHILLGRVNLLMRLFWIPIIPPHYVALTANRPTPLYIVTTNLTDRQTRTSQIKSRTQQT